MGAVDSACTSSRLDEIVSLYTDTIDVACTKATSIPKIGKPDAKDTPPWWTEELQVQKREVLRRKRRLRNAAPSRRVGVYEEYSIAKEQLDEMIKEAQTRSWNEFCSTQDGESMWDGV